MTPEGHALSAWITFSAYRDGDGHGRPGPGARADERSVHRADLHARRQPDERPLLGADAREPRALARGRGAGRRRPKVCVDRRRQWQYAGNVRHSAARRWPSARSRHPARWLSAAGDRLSGDGVPTGRAVDAADARRDRRRRRAERARCRDRARPGGPVGPRLRGGGHRRRRHALGRADAARASSTTYARRSIRWRSRRPSSGPLDLARHGVEWVHPDAPWPTCSTPGRAVILERSVDGTAVGPGSRRGRVAPRLRPARRGSRTGSLPSLLGPVVRPPRHPSPGPLRAAGLLPATTLRVSPSASRRPGRCSPGMAAHSMLRARRAADGLVRARARDCSRTRSAGRFARGGQRPSPTRSWPRRGARASRS